MNSNKASHTNDKEWKSKVTRICEITGKDFDYVNDALASYDGN